VRQNNNIRSKLTLTICPRAPPAEALRVAPHNVTRHASDLFAVTILTFDDGMRLFFVFVGAMSRSFEAETVVSCVVARALRTANAKSRGRAWDDRVARRKMATARSTTYDSGLGQHHRRRRASERRGGGAGRGNKAGELAAPTHATTSTDDVHV